MREAEEVKREIRMRAQMASMFLRRIMAKWLQVSCCTHVSEKAIDKRALGRGLMKVPSSLFDSVIS